MTRKRYTKLLMSRGYDRNEAQRKAEQAQKSGLSYREAYMMDCRWFTLTGSINKDRQDRLCGEQRSAGFCRDSGGKDARRLND